MPEARNSEGWQWKVADIAVKIVVPVLLALCSWLMTSHAELQERYTKLESRVRVIEATRYTKGDANEVTKALGEISVRLARIETKLESR